MKKYRKKPVVVEAILIPDKSEEAYAIRDHLRRLGADIDLSLAPGMAIRTLEGMMHANPGDYIIKGIKGEFYPCKPDIFEQTYEVVDD
jgi:hypothetical protein